VEVRDRQAELEALHVSVIGVGFSPPAALAALADHLGWPWPFYSDTQRRLYRRLDLPRARARDVYNAGTLARYASALARGTRIQRPVEDTRQLGGDALVNDGVVLRLWRPRSPDDRPAVADMLEALRELSGR
jgi:AhpC/TSA antioxidant enzyme